MPTVGQTTSGSSAINLTAGYCAAAGPYTPDGNGDVDQVSMYTKAAGTNFQLAIYADSAGKPGALLGTTGTGVSVLNGWVTLALPVPVTVSTGSQYWIGYQVQTNATGMLGYTSGSGIKSYFKATTWPTWVESLTSGGSNYNLFAVYASTAEVSDSLTISAPVEWQTYQRNGSNQADIAISGTYTGTPTAIEASFNGGAYATIDASPSGGTFSGTLSAQAAGQGALTVRFTNDTSVSDTVANVGIGDVFLVIGDSIAEGYGQNAQSDSHATLQAACFRQDDAWKEGNDPIDTGGQGKSHWPLLATWIETDQSVPVAFVTCATGATDVYGTGDNEWAKPNSAYTEMQNQASAYGGTFKAVLAHLGPNAIVNATTPSQANYNAALDTLASNIQADIQASLPLCLGLCGEVNTGSPPDRTAAMDNVRNAIVEAWGDNAAIKPGPVLIDQDYSDNVHPYTDAQLQQLAARWWAALHEAVYSGPSGRGPRISSATYAASTVTLTFDADLAEADEATYTTTAFAVTDGSGSRTVSSVTKTGARTVAVAVSGGVLAGTVTCQFASANTAAGATVPTRSYTMPDTSTVGLPAEPFSTTATDANVPLATGTASFVSSGPTAIACSCTAASGGVEPYAYQWQRSETSGSGFSDLSGKTELTLSDATAVEGTLYYYKLKTTDAASDVVYSGEVSAEIYDGGELGSGGYTYGDNDPDYVLTTAVGAGNYVPIADSDTVDGGVSYGVGEEGTGVNAATILAALGLETGNLDDQLSGIKAKTDNLPDSPATEAKQDTIIALLGTPADTDLSTDVAAVKTVVDNLSSGEAVHVTSESVNITSEDE